MTPDPFRLDGKTVLVTGGLTGIGRAIALDCADAGADVIVASRHRELGDAEERHWREGGHRVRYRPLDVTDVTSIAVLMDELATGDGLDVLVNNAGTTAWVESDSERGMRAWREVMSVNLDGVWNVSTAAAGLLRSGGGGTVVNVGSMSGSIVNRPQAQTAYNTSKAAVHHLTRSLAAEWWSGGIRVNAVAPGYVSTPMLEQQLDDPEFHRYWVGDTVMQRAGSPEEVARAVRFLASSASSYITGAVLPVDGGYTLW